MIAPADFLIEPIEPADGDGLPDEAAEIVGAWLWELAEAEAGDNHGGAEGIFRD